MTDLQERVTKRIIDALQERIAELEIALRPFVQTAVHHTSLHQPEDHIVWRMPLASGLRTSGVTRADVDFASMVLPPHRSWKRKPHEAERDVI